MIPTGSVSRSRVYVAAYALTWCAAVGGAPARPVQFPAPGPIPAFEVQRISLEGLWGVRAARSSATTLTLGYKATIYDFELIRLRVLNGNTLYSQILANVQPYRPNFLLRGPEPEMQTLVTTRPGEHVEIVGWIHSGGRDMFVSSVQVRPPATPTPPAP